MEQEMTEQSIIKLSNNKTNKKFMLLSVFGIIFVVMGHCNGVDAFFANVFPFYSFHMGLFAFISGYFFKDRKIIDFLKYKTKTLIITYLIWNLIYGIIINILKKLDLIYFGGELNLYNILISPFLSSSNQFNFNVAAWFVIAIYFVQLIYFFLNKLLKGILGVKTEIIVTIVSIVIATVELKLLSEGKISTNISYIITRIAFLMPLYSIGQIYKSMEKYDKLHNIIYFSIILLIQIVLIQKFGDLSYNLNILTFEYNYIVYLISSLTGILFWLRISNIFKEFASENKIINYISNNTYTIMMHHMFVFYIFNLFIYLFYSTTGRFGKFDIIKFKDSIWYVYDKNNPALILLYVSLGIVVPLLFKFIYDKIINIIKNKIVELKKEKGIYDGKLC